MSGPNQQHSARTLRRHIVTAVALLVGALVVSIVWANVHNWRNRNSMRQTERLMRGDAMVLEHYRQSKGAYPEPNYLGSAVGLRELAAYGKLFQPADGWGRPLLYSCSQDGTQYSLMSLGSNARSEFVGQAYWSDEQGIGDSAVDVVIRNGEWLSHDLGMGDPGGRIMPNERFLDALSEMQRR